MVCLIGSALADQQLEQAAHDQRTKAMSKLGLVEEGTHNLGGLDGAVGLQQEMDFHANIRTMPVLLHSASEYASTFLTFMQDAW